MLKHLVVISHTEHYLNSEGKICGWGSTITELNYLAQHWDKITHVACFYEETAPANALPYTESNIEFKAIPPFGGKGIRAKLGILLKMPTILSVIKKNIKDASEVQLRLPTGMGVVLLPWFSLRKRNYLFWVKYAGNWAHPSPPLGYRFQRWWLQKNLARCKVTINGRWPDQPAQCKSFENPCLFESEVDRATSLVESKNFDQLEACFVGRLGENKGVLRILEALATKQGIQNIKAMHFVGDGPLMQTIKEKAAGLSMPVKVHGFLSREETAEIYKKSHIIFLPSDSEGFPKVIAEAMCYGCIPVVSDVSSIGQYVNESNGFLWDVSTEFAQYFEALDLSESALKKRSGPAHELSYAFTFEAYFRKLNKNVFLKGS